MGNARSGEYDEHNIKTDSYFLHGPTIIVCTVNLPSPHRVRLSFEQIKSSTGDVKATAS
jgi:hypothetical protein